MSDRGRVDVVVAGAINTDLVALVDRAPEAGETITGESFAVFGGGKGANQAVAARRSGASVALVGAIGDDAFGSQRCEDLGSDGIDLEGVARIDGMASGVALITVESGGENRIAYIPGPTLEISGNQIRTVLKRTQPAVYLQPNEVPLEAARSALLAARQIDAITILNAAPDPENVRILLPDVDYLIVNEGEAMALAGMRGSFEEVAATLARQSGVSIVLTAGADGAFGYHDGESLHAAGPAVDVVDTTGAGDTFCGAFAACLAKGDSFAAAVRWAVAAASIATTREGAQSSIPVASAVNDFLTK